jgi:prevent-host-death family protein
MNVPISEAKARLTDLVRRAEAGDEVVLTRHGRSVVRLAPVAGGHRRNLNGTRPLSERAFSGTHRPRFRHVAPDVFGGAGEF